MKLGCVYPQIELGGDPAAVKAFALAAEEMGFDHIVAYDHVLGAEHAGREPELWGPYTEKDPFHEPLMMFSYLSGVTERIEFMTGVIILPQRQTALVAKQVADLDLFSGERLRLGVGVGWNWVEYDALEMPDHFRRRGRRQEDQIDLMRKLWADSVIEHRDRDHTIERAGILPLPTRQVPIWLGGFTTPAWDRAAALGDGFLYAARQDDAIEVKGYIEQKRAESGRADVAFGDEWIAPFGGGPDKWASRRDAWQDAGGSHMSVVTMGNDLTSVEAHIDALGQWKDTMS